MNTNPGIFLAIEGTDGSGKGTQFQRLADRLAYEGYDVATFDFPQYEQQSSYFVKQYLNGNYGGIEDVGPYTSSLFYALDRYEAAPKIREALEQGKIVIANRYVGSNMAHQGTKFHHVEERRGYFIWLDNLEFEMLKIPRPTLSLVLRVPADIAQNQVDKKAKRQYTDNKRDLHEADLEHLSKAVEVYDDICKLFPKDFSCIDCTRNGKLVDIGIIHEIMWRKVQPLLPSKKATAKAVRVKPARMVVEDTYLTTPTARHETTDASERLLAKIITNPQATTYAFTHELSPFTIASAMAQLTSGSKDMRTIILAELASSIDKDQLVQHATANNGHSPTQELAGIHMAVEQASDLLIKRLASNRVAAYAQQQTRYVDFENEDSQGSYKYHTPENLQPAIKKQYRSYMDQIFDLHAGLVQTLTEYLKSNASIVKEKQDTVWQDTLKVWARDAAQSVLPVAATSTVGIYATGGTIERILTDLLSEALPEAQSTGEMLLKEARKIAPWSLEHIGKPYNGVTSTEYRSNAYVAVEALAREYLPDTYTVPVPPVQLVAVWPRNEIDLIADMLYEHSNLPLKELQRQVAAWPYEQKSKVFEAYIGERLSRHHYPGQAFEKAHYSWDLTCTYEVFRDLQRSRMVETLEWQELTPRYGYDTPKLVDEAGLTHKFETCFDLSLRLHSLLQEAGYTAEAQYATLFGHRQRIKLTYNAREAFRIHEIATHPHEHPEYQKLLMQMHERISEVHPIIGEAMKFVNGNQRLGLNQKG